MKRYTMQGAIHDARVFYQLWLEYRRANRKPRKRSHSSWLSRYLAATGRRVRA